MDTSDGVGDAVRIGGPSVDVSVGSSLVGGEILGGDRKFCFASVGGEFEETGNSLGRVCNLVWQPLHWNFSIG